VSDTLDPDDDGTGSTRVRSRESVGLGPVPAYQGEVTTVRSSSTSLLGQMLGEYRVLEPLGSGAQGDVFRGEHPVLHRQVAIKVLKPEYAVDANHKRRFLDEARAVIAARHPGIIDIFGVGETPDDRPWFVMELLEGEPLDLLLRGGPLSVTEAVKLLVPITQALGAAHAVGVIHRDLKPANIFVVQLPDGARFPKLLDFGLARRGEAGARVAQTSVGGTPLYLAPEQARGEAVGPQTDLYSLGCVAYEMLCGQPPFALTDLHALLDAHATLAPASLHSRGAVVPARLQQLITRLLAKQLSARPASAKEVREVLEQVQVDLARDGSPHATLQETELGEAPEVPSARRASAAASSRPRLGAVGETPSYSRRRSELGTTPETPPPPVAAWSWGAPPRRPPPRDARAPHAPAAKGSRRCRTPWSRARTTSRRWCAGPAPPRSAARRRASPRPRRAPPRSTPPSKHRLRVRGPSRRASRSCWWSSWARSGGPPGRSRHRRRRRRRCPGSPSP
jgi:serine/threonine-protein kinase